MSKLKTALIVIAACIGLTTTAAFAGGHTTAAPDIVDVAAANGSFNTLVAAVTAAGLVDALKGDGPLTVFAPTDEAFAALPAGTAGAAGPGNEFPRFLQPTSKPFPPRARVAARLRW